MRIIDLETPVEKVFLVAVDTGSEDGWTAQESLSELASLASTAGVEVVGAEWQNRRHVDPNWYIGKGKAEELAAAKRETGFDVLIADDELSPSQQRSLEELLNVKVIDRSRLILDIFAQHAQTHEGRLQVELAQLEYQLPRLTRLWTHLSRTQGGIGSRGPGESQLETDRRIIRTRISKMKERVEQVRQQRDTAARGRDRRLWPTVGIVGYTNAGKSTLLNTLVGADVAKAEDKLFATLDPDVAPGQARRRPDGHRDRHRGLHPQAAPPARRRLPGDPRGGQPGGRPHRGRRCRRSPSRGASGHRPDRPRRARGRGEAAGRGPQQGRSRGAGRPRRRRPPAPVIGGAVMVSALTGFGMDTLKAEVAAVLASLWVDVDIYLPYAAGELLARVRERGTVEIEYGERDVHVRGRVAPAVAGELEAVAGRWVEALGTDAATPS